MTNFNGISKCLQKKIINASSKVIGHIKNPHCFKQLDMGIRSTKAHYRKALVKYCLVNGEIKMPCIKDAIIMIKNARKQVKLYWVYDFTTLKKIKYFFRVFCKKNIFTIHNNYSSRQILNRIWNLRIITLLNFSTLTISCLKSRIYLKFVWFCHSIFMPIFWMASQKVMKTFLCKRIGKISIVDKKFKNIKPFRKF